jgi:hypothetical protein
VAAGGDAHGDAACLKAMPSGRRLWVWAARAKLKLYEHSGRTLQDAQEVRMLQGHEDLPRQIAPGMAVCDVSGEKVGTVARIGDIVEVKTGPFGLGGHLYVPPDAVEAITEAGLILKHSKREFHAYGLDTRPIKEA